MPHVDGMSQSDLGPGWFHKAADIRPLSGNSPGPSTMAEGAEWHWERGVLERLRRAYCCCGPDMRRH